jgi:hypothetical protein
VKQFLANKNITVMEHPPYLPDLAPCDFYLFPKIKSVLKGTHFLSVEDVKVKTTEILNSLTENDMQNCFERWQHHMQLCVNSEGNYFEGDIVNLLNLSNRNSYRHSLVFFVSDLVLSGDPTHQLSVDVQYFEKCCHHHHRRCDWLPSVPPRELHLSHIPPLASVTLRMVIEMHANALQQQHYVTKHQTSQLHRLSDIVLAIIFAHSDDETCYVVWYSLQMF